MINRIFRDKFILTFLQFIALVVFALLILGAFGITTNDAAFAKILRNTNLSNLIVWSYWWPLIIVTAIFFGRFWCSICPMEMATTLFGKIGLRRKPGKILKSGWFITLFYSMILILGIHTFAIHRIPHYMALYMLLLFAVAILSGLIWEKRTFCTYICPVGHLLGFYSLFSFKKLRVENQNVCQSCNTKDCISKESHYKFVSRSCTSELYPPKITDNRKCILCSQCFKSCSKNNIAITSRPFANDLTKKINFSWAELAFFMLLSSFVVYEILSEWKVSKSIIMYLPNHVNDFMNIHGNMAGTIKALLLFVLLPVLFYGLFAHLNKWFSKKNIKESLSLFTLTLLPIVAGMHLLKAILKTSSRIPYWKYAISEPDGIGPANRILNNPDLLSNSFLSNLQPVISIIAILLPIIALFFSFSILKKQQADKLITKIFAIAVIIIYASIFLIPIIAWRI